MPSLAIILVNFNGASDTIACLQSLRESRFRDFEVIVIDNGSSDGLAEKMGGQFPEATLLKSETNRGFAGGNNLGIKEALRRGAGMILLLNNDTVVEPDALGALVKGIDRHGAGIIGPKVLYFDPPRSIWFAGGIFRKNLGTGEHRGLGERDDGQWNIPGPCDYITGCALLARHEVFSAVGLLDEGFFAYLEDLDFCLRARNAGFQVWYEPAAQILHKVSRSSGWDSPVYLYLNSRNKLLLLQKHPAGARSFFPLTWFFIRQFTRLLVKHRDLAGARAVWYGLVDGLRKTVGNGSQGRLARIQALPRKPR